MKKHLKNILAKFGYEIRRKSCGAGYRKDVVRLKVDGNNKGNILLAYIIEPYLDDGFIDDTSHSHFWESFEIGKLFLNLGYSVDVIDYRNSDFQPEKRYDILVSARTSLEKLAAKLNPDCKIIAHLDTAHWLANNQASLTRCLNLKARKGIVLKSWRIVEPNNAIEKCQMATILGNSYTIDTYGYAGKKIFRIPITSCAVFEWNEHKDHGKVSNNFLWIGSHGFVHKGLDITLEAFAEMPEMNLYVCGPIENEPEFKKAYHKELFATGNIHTLGWVDVRSKEFFDLANKCIGVVYPSCAEGGGGSVVTCMHAGLVPIVTREASVDIEDFGVTIHGSTVKSVIDAVGTLADETGQKLKMRAQKAWVFARNNHSRKNFSDAYLKFIENSGILKN